MHKHIHISNVRHFFFLMNAAECNFFSWIYVISMILGTNYSYFYFFFHVNVGVLCKDEWTSERCYFCACSVLFRHLSITFLCRSIASYHTFFRICMLVLFLSSTLSVRIYNRTPNDITERQYAVNHIKMKMVGCSSVNWIETLNWVNRAIFHRVWM